MKWFTHQAIAVAGALALGMPPVGVGGVVLGSVLPDVIDQRLAKLTPHPQKTFNRIHRGASHWFGWYAALMLLALVVPVSAHISLNEVAHALGLSAATARHLAGTSSALLPPLLAGIGFGALMHVVLDMLTPSGVPLTPFSRQNKLSLKLCSTGSLGEYLFLAVGLGLLALLAGQRWPEMARALEKLL